MPIHPKKKNVLALKKSLHSSTLLISLSLTQIPCSATRSGRRRPLPAHSRFMDDDVQLQTFKIVLVGDGSSGKVRSADNTVRVHVHVHVRVSCVRGVRGFHGQQDSTILVNVAHSHPKNAYEMYANANFLRCTSFLKSICRSLFLQTHPL